jgi:hypothetical protein
MASERRQIGDRRACGTCKTDIEWHGKAAGWIDRGGNKFCDTSGQGWQDINGAPQKYPHRKHRPESVFQLPEGARRT